MKKINLFLLAAVLIIACGCGSQSNGDSSNVKMKRFNNKMAAGLDYKGTIVHGEAWEDVNGKNFVIFTQTIEETFYEEGPGDKSVYLYAYHFADKGDGYQKMVRIRDWEENCGLVQHAGFRLHTLNITDIDNDGVAEITFVYRLGCNSDPTPVTMKLMMLENGVKYAIRGTTLVELGSEMTYGGEMTVDPAFNNAPNGFLDFAKKIWESDKSYF